MILDVFKYYAQFPDISGVKRSFVNGRSTLALYGELLAQIEGLKSHSRIPEIADYIFGQSYDSVKERVDAVSGTYLFVEFGEISSNRDQRNSIRDQFKIAVTIASKVGSMDLVEQAVISETALQLIHRLRVFQFSDQQAHPWLKEISNGHSIVPFVAKEFNSLGWTMIFNREGADMMGLKDAIRTL